MSSALTGLVPAIGWALLHFIWQGLLIGWGVALAMHLLRGARPQIRYAVCCGAMLLCAALPLSSILMSLADAGATAASATATGADSGATTTAAAAASSAAVGQGVAAGLWQMVAAAIPVLFDDETLFAAESMLRRQLPWIVGLWLAGAALMSLRLAIGLKWVAERTRASEYTVNHYWQRRLSELARRFDIDTHVRLGVADRLDSPITAGCWRPIVLVPASLVTGMPADLLEALLAHELAHIKRHDYLVNLIQSAIEIVLFYHPSVWALSRRIRIEREQIADDLAVAKLGQPQKLAQALSELDRFQFATTQLAHAAHGGNLMSRIKRLLRPDVEPVSWKMAMPLLGLCAAGAVFYAHAAPPPPAAPELPAPPALIEIAAPAALPALPEPAEAAEVPAAPAPVAPVAPAAPAAPAAPMLVEAVAPAIAATPAAAAAPAMPAIAAVVAAPAIPAVRASFAVPPIRIERASMSDRDSNLTYALVPRDSDRMIVSASRKDLARVAEMRRAIKSDFIWFRDGDKSYVIQDPAVVAKANEAWQASNRIGAAMEEQGDKMEVHGKVMEAIGAEMEAKTRLAEGAPSRDMELIERKMEAVGRQQEAIGRRIEQAAREMERDISQNRSPERGAKFREAQAKLRAEMEPLQRQMAQYGREMAAQHAQLAAAQAPLRELGAKMSEASRPMAELGKRMQELGREQAKASREAERTLKELIRDSVKNGKATPAPSVS